MLIKGNNMLIKYDLLVSFMSGFIVPYFYYIICLFLSVKLEFALKPVNKKLIPIQGVTDPTN